MASRNRWKGLLALVGQTFSEWNKHNGQQLGAALAYYCVLSIAPLLVIAVALAGFFFGAKAARGQVFWEIRDLVGPKGAAMIQDALQNANQPGTGVLATCLGVLMLLLGASGVFNELRSSLNWIWEVPKKPGSSIVALLRDEFLSFALVLAMGFLLVVSLLLTTVITVIGTYFEGLLPAPAGALHLVTYVANLLGITGLFAAIYKFIPDVDLEWRDVVIGAAVTSVLFTGGKFLIGVYLGKAGVGSAYGAAGSLVLVLVWVYYSSQIFYFGAEFTRMYARRHGSRAPGQALPAWRKQPEILEARP